MGNVSEHYDAQELVHPAIIHRYGIDRVVRFLPVYAPWLIATAEAVRDWVQEPVTINNYMWDPEYKRGGWDAISDRGDLYINSGLRDFAVPFKGSFSGHYAWVCLDHKPKTYDTGQLQEDIIRNPRTFPSIVRMENAKDTRSSRGKLGRDWLHTQSGILMPGQEVEIFRP